MKQPSTRNESATCFSSSPIANLFCIKSYIEKRSKAQTEKIKIKLPELLQLEAVLIKFLDRVTINLLETIKYNEVDLPIYEVVLGRKSTYGATTCQAKNSQELDKQPHLLLVGGVHGIERIGARVIISLLSTWLERLVWEKSLQYSLLTMGVTFIPIANPAGMYLNKRGNGNGVDLMRNAPINAVDKASFLVGGQRISSNLMWYRGCDAQMEQENLAIEKVVNRLCQNSSFLLSLDCHSGFGLSDQIWFPYAYRRKPMSDIAPLLSLKLLLDKGYPNHCYKFEPQSMHYLTHGDLWDYLYKNHKKERCTFIPLTLELGSWAWLKKKPSQILSMEGLFNPMATHREQRTLRRHLPFFDFLRHACFSFENWLPNSTNEKAIQQIAHKLWYPEL